MEVVRWAEDQIEQLGPGIGRQMVNTGLLTVAMIHLAEGAVVPRHAHHNEQVATVLSGRLRFAVGDEEAVVGPGESVVLPPDVPHEVEALEDTVVIDVFSPRREDWLSGDDSYLRR